MEYASYKSPASHPMIKRPHNTTTKWSCHLCLNRFRDRKLTTLKCSLALDRFERQKLLTEVKSVYTPQSIIPLLKAIPSNMYF